MKSCVFTVCNIAYLPRAMLLAKSVRKTSGLTLKIILFESRKKFGDLKKSCDAEILFAEELGFADFYHLAMIYDVVELTTALKPRITRLLCKNFDYVYFFDPDVIVYQNVINLEQEFREKSVLLTPHYNTPETSDIWNNDVGLMRFGAFNLGFFAVKTCKDSEEFLSWWDNRCTYQCFFETQFGLSTDQKWLNVAFAFFDCFEILRSPVYNFAYWNAFERFQQLQIVDGEFYVDHVPLFFAHISSFDPNEPDVITKRGNVAKQDKTRQVLKLYREYADMLNDLTSAWSSYLSRKYTYDYFDSGEKIGAPLRIAYLDFYKSNRTEINPFSDVELMRYAKKRNLLGSETTMNVSLANKDRHGLTYFMRAFVRIAVLIVGAKRYKLFCNGLLLLSSPRTLSDVWKFRRSTQ